MDPLGELEDSLAYLFELQKIEGQGKYINPLVEELKRAIENYKKDSGNISPLTLAISKASPIIENYTDSYTVKQKMDALLKSQNKTIGLFNTVNPGQASFFQFANPTKNNETNFISWLSLKIGKNFALLSNDMQVQILITRQSEKELRVKLGVHLRMTPDFLIDLALASANNFIKLLKSRLGFKFEKHQIARAIYHHSEAMIDSRLDSFEQIDKLISFLDKELLPKGYSIEKLLNDPLAKVELEKLPFIQFYQSPEYKNYQGEPINQIKC
jgi:hypothetical protein